METILGKSPAIFNGHQPPRADDPYEHSYDYYPYEHYYEQKNTKMNILMTANMNVYLKTHI